MSEYKIEKGIPIPKPIMESPLLRMEVGDSMFLVDGKQRAILMTQYQRLKKKRAIKFITRAEGTGYRIWRTA